MNGDPGHSVEQKQRTPRVVIATTVALSFISMWRASAIVLGDLASTMFYAGGIAEQAIGRSAPWFVLGVMLFSFAVRTVFMESCSMFVRGGVYVVVRDAMGHWMARLSVSALLFDYLLTGPISSVSAGHYVGRLIDELLQMGRFDYHVNAHIFSVIFAMVVTIYFWRQNVEGLHESSGKALRIIQITTVMVAALLIWCPITLITRGSLTLPPLPSMESLQWGPNALGWFEGTVWPQMASVAFIIAFGHAFLSMSGFETLAQVYRELSYPKLTNLKRMGLLVCSYAFVSTGLITLFAAAIIPPDVRSNYYDNLIGGLTMHLSGPLILRLAFHAFVVLVGALILSAAVNTSIIGANAVLNRVAEDGVLLGWFRRPHERYGTTYRMINTIVLLQIVTIILSRGDVYLLGEAYAFGVVWSFFLKSCGVLVLRYQRNDQEYKTPLNLRLGMREIPAGLIVVTLALFFVALANVVSKQLATVWGATFTGLLFVLFTVSEHVNQRRRSTKGRAELEEFNLEFRSDPESAISRDLERAVLIGVRDYNALSHLEWALNDPTLAGSHFIVTTLPPLSSGFAQAETPERQYFSEYEKELFSKVVSIAEKAGKAVDLLVTPAYRPLSAVVQTAARLRAGVLVIGDSPVVSPEELARLVGLAWERLPAPRPPLTLLIVQGADQITMKLLGPHMPRLAAEDVERVHRLWLELSGTEDFGAQLHHDSIVKVALKRMERAVRGQERNGVIDDIRRELEGGGGQA